MNKSPVIPLGDLPLDYKRIYDNLIRNARNSYPWGISEIHHIQPTSMGGTNDWDNLVRVSPKLHSLLHLILWRLGERNQIFSVMLVRERHHMRKTKFLRRIHNREEQRVMREARKRGEIWNPEQWDE